MTIKRYIPAATGTPRELAPAKTDAKRISIMLDEASEH
jgi:hypothetical protein